MKEALGFTQWILYNTDEKGKEQRELLQSPWAAQQELVSGLFTLRLMLSLYDSYAAFPKAPSWMNWPETGVSIYEITGSTYRLSSQHKPKLDTGGVQLKAVLSAQSRMDTEKQASLILRAPRAKAGLHGWHRNAAGFQNGFITRNIWETESMADHCEL